MCKIQQLSKSKASPKKTTMDCTRKDNLSYLYKLEIESRKSSRKALRSLSTEDMNRIYGNLS